MAVEQGHLKICRWRYPMAIGRSRQVGRLTVSGPSRVCSAFSCSSELSSNWGGTRWTDAKKANMSYFLDLLNTSALAQPCGFSLKTCSAVPSKLLMSNGGLYLKEYCLSWWARGNCSSKDTIDSWRTRNIAFPFTPAKGTSFKRRSILASWTISKTCFQAASQVSASILNPSSFVITNLTWSSSSFKILARSLRFVNQALSLTGELEIPALAVFAPASLSWHRIVTFCAWKDDIRKPSSACRSYCRLNLRIAGCVSVKKGQSVFI